MTINITQIRLSEISDPLLIEKFSVSLSRKGLFLAGALGNFENGGETRFRMLYNNASHARIGLRGRGR